MMRFIIIFIAVSLVYFILKKTVLALLQNNQTEKVSKHEKMLACDYCQTHIPASEAIKHGDKNFCCPEHQDLWLKEQNDS